MVLKETSTLNQASLKIVLGLAGVFCTALYGLHQSLEFQAEISVIITAVALLLLEQKSPRHRLYGFAPTTYPLYIFLALTSTGSVGVAVAAALLAIGLRTATSKREQGSWKAWEFVVDTAAITGSLAVLKALTSFGPKWGELPVIAILAAILFHFLSRPVLQSAWMSELPEEECKKWQADHVRATTLLSFVSFLALPYGFLANTDPAIAFFLPLGPFLLATAIAPMLDPTKDPAKIRLSQTLKSVRSTLDETSKAAHTAETALELRKEDFSFLQQLAESLPHQPTQKGVLEDVLWLARRLSTCDSVVVFLEEDGKLRAWEESKTSFKKALEAAFQEGRDEPVVRRAFKTRRAEFVRLTDADDGRIFLDEATAVAVPIHDQGAIYLGRASDELFTDDEVSRLTVLGQQAHLALRAARFSEARETALISEAEARHDAEFLLAGVASIVNIMSELISIQDPDEILHKTGLRLGKIVSHDFWVIHAGEPDRWPPTHSASGPPSKPKHDEKAVLEIAELTMQRGVPLMDGDLKGSALPQPTKGTRSVLSCPLVGEGGSIGALLLFSSKSEAFKPREKDLLAAFGYQLGSHFYNSVLHNKLSQTHAELANAHKDLKKSQTHLVQSSKMAAVGQLAAGVAHELNTPLGALMLAIEGSLKTLAKKPERAENRLNRALTSASQLKEIVSKLLFYSREGTIEEQETDLNKVIDDTLSLIGNQLALDDIEFQRDSKELDIVMANQNEIQQIVINLLTNAKDAVLARKDDVPKKIILTTSNFSKAVELAIQDNGVGMDEKTQERVFEPFFTTKAVGRGTGLGLSVTKELVEKHGGAIRVQSTPGEGTRIVLRLPKVKA